MPNLNHNFFLLTLLFTLPIVTNAQTAYEGQVINSITEAPLIKASVNLSIGKQGAITNEQGYFRLIVQKPAVDDTLVVSFVGFKTYRSPLSAYEPNMFIRLEPAVNQLEEVNVGTGKVSIAVLENFNYADVRDLRGKHYYATTPYVTIGWFAKQFEAPKDGSVLNSINLGRRITYDIPFLTTDFPRTSTNKLTRFLLHVITCDSLTTTPANIIFTKEVTLNDNSLMISFDLKKEKIVLPSKKFFIAIQWLYIPLNEIVMIDIGKKLDKMRKDGSVKTEDVSKYFILYQPFLVRMPGKSTVPTWVSRDGKKWNPTTAGRIALSAVVSN